MISQPRYRGAGPVVLYDESHLEVHKATGTYGPFVSLLESDGYVVRVNKQPLDLATLSTAKALVVVNARGPDEAGDSSVPTGGRAQGVALGYGRGRIVIIAEAASLSAQVDGDRLPRGHPPCGCMTRHAGVPCCTLN